MNIEDYAEKARATAKYQGGIAYAALGLVGEATEYLENPSIDEAGDVHWFCVAMCDEIEADVVSVAFDVNTMVRQLDSPRPELAMVVAAGRVAEYVKKQIGNGKDRSPEIQAALTECWAYLCKLQPVAECWEHNIAKLAARTEVLR